MTDLDKRIDARIARALLMLGEARQRDMGAHGLSSNLARECKEVAAKLAAPASEAAEPPLPGIAEDVNADGPMPFKLTAIAGCSTDPAPSTPLDEARKAYIEAQGASLEPYESEPIQLGGYGLALGCVNLANLYLSRSDPRAYVFRRYEPEEVKNGICNFEDLFRVFRRMRGLP